MTLGPKRQRRGAFVVAMLITALLVAPSPARSNEGTAILTLRGESNSYAEVRLDAPATVRPSETAVSTTGTYAGFAIYAMPGHHFRTALYWVTAFEEMGSPFPPLTFSRNEVVLDPGVYRIYLVADGPSTVKTRIEGLARPLKLRPATLARMEAGVLDLAVAPLATLGAASIPVRFREGGQVFMIAMQVAHYHQASRMAMCVADPGVRDCALGARNVYSDFLFPAPSVFRGYFRAFAAGDPRPGAADLVFNVAGVGLSESLLGFYLVIHP